MRLASASAAGPPAAIFIMRSAITLCASSPSCMALIDRSNQEAVRRDMEMSFRDAGTGRKSPPSVSEPNSNPTLPPRFQ